MSQNAPESCEGVQAVVGDGAVARAADGDVLHLGAAVAEADHRLAARLLPPQRAADPLGQADRAGPPPRRCRSWRRSRRRRPGVRTRTSSSSTPFAATIGCLTPWACCVEIHWCRRPSTHATAEPRTSSGHGATRWFTKRPVAVTSQSAKNSSPVRSGMPSAVVSNTTLLPAASYRAAAVGRRLRVDRDVERSRSRRARPRRRRPPGRAVSATTAAIGSPTKRTRSDASNVRATAGLYGDGTGSSPRSAAVNTPSTPGMPAASATVDRRDRAVGDGRPDVGDVGGVGQLGDVVQVVDVPSSDGEELRVFLPDDTDCRGCCRAHEPPGANGDERWRWVAAL